MTYYKATRPDGKSFHDGTTAWATGETVKIEMENRRADLCGVGILHASDAPGETLIGGRWPCRLFEVEGEPVAQEDHKFGFHELTVIRELPAWQALGPNGEAVTALIERSTTITPEQAERLRAARDAASGAAWNAAWNAAYDTALVAALGLVVRDLITPEQFDLLYGPWASVMEAEG